MENSLTEVYTTKEGNTYTLKTRVSWFDFQKADQAGEVVVFELGDEAFSNLAAAAAAVQNAGGVANTEAGVMRCEYRVDRAVKDRERLKTWVCNLSMRQLMGISPTDAVELLRRIEVLEQEERARIEELLPGNPTTTP